MCQVSEMKIRKKCTTPEDSIALFIMKDGKELKICKSCWERIGNLDWEIGPDPKPIAEEILGRRVKEETAATPTEYDPSKKGAGRYKEKSIAQQEDEVAEAEGKALMEEDEERESQEEVSKS